jgi:CDP-4-dehydro-6-deoxyglucose reductase
MHCHVTQADQLNPSTYLFKLAPHTPLFYWPGQYLTLCIGQHKLLYSIANAPETQNILELHISDNSPLAKLAIQTLFKAKKNNQSVYIDSVNGDCYIEKTPSKALIMICSGSGFSQIKCLTEAILSNTPSHTLHLYWSNKKVDDFYCLTLLNRWRKKYVNFQFDLILESKNSINWQGRQGSLPDMIKQDYSTLHAIDMYACGSPNRVYGTLKALGSLGLSQNNMYSDVFSYALNDTPK